MKKYILLAIFLLALALRLYDINWDQGYHLQPDEREITLVTLTLHLPITPQDWANLLTPQSTLNPKFFAYGSLPIYLLFLLGQILNLASYDRIAILGRVLSALADSGTVLLVFWLGKKLINRSVGIIGALFYTFSVLPIQLSHFYAVDTLLTFFITLTLILSICYYEKPSFKKAIILGLFLGAALTTKISSLVLLAPVLLSLGIDFCLIFLKTLHQPRFWIPHITKTARKVILEGFLIIGTAAATFVIFEPYALIDNLNFYQQNLEQAAMTKDPFVFPYTLQYVGIPHYIYEIKNIFLWGLGPILALICFIGVLYVTFIVIKRTIDHPTPHQTNISKFFLLLVFFWIYLGIVGSFAIGFIRYMLPVYPLLCFFGAIFLWQIIKIIKFKLLQNVCYILCFILILIWPLSFMHIYSKDNTRVLATKWIIKNIPIGGKIAVEHWDDTLPLGIASNFQMFTLPLYDPETPAKWQLVSHILNQTDYIVIASNRLYVPLQKLTDCRHLPPGKCYTQTAQYYKELFNGSLGFKKVAQFSIHPQFSILGFKILIDDSSADESFTVYDHPTVMIFKKSAS